MLGCGDYTGWFKVGVVLFNLVLGAHMIKMYWNTLFSILISVLFLCKMYKIIMVVIEVDHRKKTLLLTVLSFELDFLHRCISFYVFSNNYYVLILFRYLFDNQNNPKRMRKNLNPVVYSKAQNSRQSFNDFVWVCFQSKSKIVKQVDWVLKLRYLKKNRLEER